jgi:hypothetical protein
LAVSKQEAQKFDVKRYNVKKLNKLEVRKEYEIKIEERFEAVENVNHSEYINRAWENIKENVKTQAKNSPDLHEMKQHKPLLDEERLRFLDQRKQAKMQWVED